MQGDWVLIQGLDVVALNGYFKVLGFPSSRSFDLLYPSAVQPPAPADYATALLPQTFQALTATLGYGGRLWGNRVIDVYTGGPYHDLGPNPPVGNREKDCHAWNNYYHFVYVGPFSSVANRLVPPPPRSTALLR